MDHVESFDSLEDMQAAMQAREDQANELLTGGERAMRDAVDRDVYFVRSVDVGEAEPLPIFGHALSRDHTLERLAAATSDTEEGREEVAAEMAAWDDARSRGYLAAECFSRWVPHGEHGDTHVSSTFEIREATFEQAREDGWEVTDESRLLAEDLDVAAMRLVDEARELRRQQLAERGVEELAPGVMLVGGVQPPPEVVQFVNSLVEGLGGVEVRLEHISTEPEQ